MKKLLSVFSGTIAILFAYGLAEAQPLYRADIECLAPDPLGTASGFANISTRGDLDIRLAGLDGVAPGTTVNCNVVCAGQLIFNSLDCGGRGVTRSGTLATRVERLVPPGTVCPVPFVEVVGPGIECESGFRVR